MHSRKSNTGQSFSSIVHDVEAISLGRHEGALLQHARENVARITHTLRDVPPPVGAKAESAVIVSAGPSVHKQKSIAKLISSGYKGSIVAVDGSLVSCLKAGLIPDYVLTLDPHETRIVRWYGDPDLEKNTENDDYFQRQDLDVEFRNNLFEQNLAHIALVNRYGSKMKAIVASSAPQNVVHRIEEAGFDAYWWNPLVDNPAEPGSLTRRLYDINRLPCMNTGGNVGTAAWVFASSILKIPTIALLGMDFGYYADLPYAMTQKYYELLDHLGSTENLEPHFPKFVYPQTGETFYTDATYFWYRKNFLELLDLSKAHTFNCTGGGVLFGDKLPCITLDEFLDGRGAQHG